MYLEKIDIHSRVTRRKGFCFVYLEKKDIKCRLPRRDGISCRASKSSGFSYRITWREGTSCRVFWRDRYLIAVYPRERALAVLYHVKRDINCPVFQREGFCVVFLGKKDINSKVSPLDVISCSLTRGVCICFRVIRRGHWLPCLSERGI